MCQTVSVFLCQTGYFSVRQVRDCSQTPVRGLMQNVFIAKHFQGPLPLQTSKNCRAPFLPWKLNSIFTGKYRVIFSRSPLTRVKHFKGPPFCIRPPPLTSACEWPLTYPVDSQKIHRPHQPGLVTCYRVTQWSYHLVASLLGLTHTMTVYVCLFFFFFFFLMLRF